MLNKEKFISIFIIILRVLSAISIYFFHFWGFIIYEFFDYWDAHLLINIARKPWSYYQKIDKRLDCIGLVVLTLVGLKYDAGLVFIILLLHRLLGQVIFEKVNKQWVLLLFPNLVEVYYIWLVLLDGYSYVVLIIIVVIKLFQEYFLQVFWVKYLRENGYPGFIKKLGIKNDINWT